ncbi:MAG: hypothetical protein IJH47_09265 [Oscillospiraceae bacterium]|nr:hypothetical protein [Oscillospiraceae bacterium]
METIRISDITMKQLAKKSDGTLTFKGKLEMAKLLDRLGVSVIEVEGLSGSRADALRVKSLATAVKESVLAVPVPLEAESVDAVWDALKEAKRPRLQVMAPVSAVQMEYLSHKKPEAMLRCIESVVSACAAKTADVEFLAEDATRSDRVFLKTAIETAIRAGASTVTVCDAAGVMLPEEFSAFVRDLFESVPALRDVTVGVAVANTMAMADACAVAAVRAGVREVKTSAVTGETASLGNIAGILAAREELFGSKCPLHMVELRRIVSQIVWLCSTRRNKTSPFDDGVQEAAPELELGFGDGVAEILRAARELGYDLNSEDGQAVWEAVRDVLKHKDRVGARELDAIIASVALQVPATYQVESYLINSGNSISAMAHLKISRNGQITEGVSLGDGPIDAAFLAIEQITHHHYELDDFQIRAVTEGHEAMGETVVRLVSNGRLYSGRGISTDIVGSSIQAYVNALNKIAYEEAEV